MIYLLSGRIHKHWCLLVLALLALPLASVAQAQPTFSKVFQPDSIEVGQVSTLVFTIDNTASGLAASALDFTDNLPAGVAVATPANVINTCTGGTLIAISGGGTISYSGGMVAASATCTISVDVTSDVEGDHVNTTGDLTSSLGNSGAAEDTLSVNPPPVNPPMGIDLEIFTIQ